MIEGTEGGLVFDDEDDQVLRYPERKSPGEINTPFKKYKKTFCLTAKVPGQYIVVFSQYGSLLHLFPNEPPQVKR